jgi:hypothetical protein
VGYNKTKERIKSRKKILSSLSVTRKCKFFLSHFEEHECFEEINGLLINHTGRGVGKSAGKIKLVQNLLEVGLNIPNQQIILIVQVPNILLRDLLKSG